MAGGGCSPEVPLHKNDNFESTEDTTMDELLSELQDKPHSTWIDSLKDYSHEKLMELRQKVFDMARGVYINMLHDNGIIEDAELSLCGRKGSGANRCMMQDIFRVCGSWVENIVVGDGGYPGEEETCIPWKVSAFPSSF